MNHKLASSAGRKHEKHIHGQMLFIHIRMNVEGGFVISRDALKKDIDALPDEALDDLHKYLLMQKFYFGVFDNDTDYLNSIKGMSEKIIAGMKEPLSECIPANEVEW